MSKKLIQALDTLEEEKGVSREIVITALEAALISAYKRHYGQAQNVEVSFDEKKGNVHVYAVKEVVDTVLDDTQEVSLEDALKINRAYEVGDKIKFEVTPSDFGRIAAQTAKQVIMQRIREAERDMIYKEYIGYEDEVLTAVVERNDFRYVIVNLGKIQAAIPKHDQIPNETYNVGDRLKVYVTKVDNTTKGPQIFVSRTHPNLLKRLFEQEVPEIYDGIVEIVSIAREAGDRSKVAVRSRDEKVDPVGTCVGPRGQRVQVIVDELNGENMDIVKWDQSPEIYIKNALNPAKVSDVFFKDDDRSCTVIVPDTQLSLAIGKRGQNARLAAKLTGFRIDIKSETEYNKSIEESAESLEESVDTATGELIEKETEEVVQDDAFNTAEIEGSDSDISETEKGEGILEPDDVESQIAEIEPEDD